MAVLIGDQVATTESPALLVARRGPATKNSKLKIEKKIIRF